MGLTFSIMLVNLHRIHKLKKDVLIKNEYNKINSKSSNVVHKSGQRDRRISQFNIVGDFPITRK